MRYDVKLFSECTSQLAEKKTQINKAGEREWERKRDREMDWPETAHEHWQQ